jgi:predicted transcriptional regulator
VKAVQEVKRTTVNLKPEIYRRLKRMAVDRDQPLQEIVNDALDRHLRATAREKAMSARFPSFRMGKTKGRLTREEIYQDR